MSCRRESRPGQIPFAALAVLHLLSSPLAALSPDRPVPQYVQDAWLIEDGLPCNTIMSVLQTRDGYLWLGTEGGLVRYDGVEFVRFDSENTQAFKSVAVSCLFEDDRGVLWIGTWGGGLVLLREGEFSHLGADGGLPGEFVRSICGDLAGDVWVGTRDGLVRFREGRRETSAASDQIGRSAVTSLLADSQGLLWVGTYGNGLHTFSGDTTLADHAAIPLPSQAVLSLCEDQRGQVWIGMDGGGVSIWQNGALTARAGSDDLAARAILSLEDDRDGNVWVGTDGGGLFRLSGADGQVTGTLAHPGRSIWALHEDREGLLWVGTNGDGLRRLKDGACVVLAEEDGLSSDRVLCVLEHGGRVWIGTEEGVDVFERGTQGFRRLPTAVPGERVMCLCEGRDGSLWMGTYGGGLYRAVDGRLVNFTRSHGLSSNLVLSLFLDRSGVLWIGTERGGVNRLCDDRFSLLETGYSLDDDLVLAITEGPGGSLWIGTHGQGVLRVRGDDIARFNTDAGLSNNSVRSIYAEADSIVWVTTFGGGLNRLAGDTITAFATRQGLPDNVIYQCLDDGRGRLWLSSNRGIFSAEKRAFAAYAAGKLAAISCERYGRSDGMRSIECNGPGGCRTADGRVWFPTVRGAVMIDPAAMPGNPLPPPVRLERVVAGGEDIPGMAFRAQPPRFKAGAGHLEFHYAGLSLADPERVFYRHRLDGLEDAWVEAGTRRTAYYTSLAPGSYCFRVTACNNHGVWNAVGDSVCFSVSPRFCDTYPFFGLCALGIAAAGAVAHTWRIRRIRARQRTLERIVADSTSQLLDRSEELEQANFKLRRLVTVDGLTGVANRRLFDEVLAREWQRASSGGGPLSLILLDIDFFKMYNDTNGHLRGDDCLVRVATTLDTTVTRGADLVARYGGDEFGVILPETDAQAAVAIAERMRERVETLGIAHAESATGGRVTLSAGIASRVPAPGGSADDLMHAADRALYHAKQTGRNRVISAHTASVVANKNQSTAGQE